MAYRSRMPKQKSKRLFSKTASKVHPKNAPVNMVRRGGMRL